MFDARHTHVIACCCMLLKGVWMHYNASLRSGGFWGRGDLRDPIECKPRRSHGTLGDAIYCIMGGYRGIGPMGGGKIRD